MRDKNPFIAEFILVMENIIITEENKKQIIQNYLEFSLEEDKFNLLVSNLENGRRGGFSPVLIVSKVICVSSLLFTVMFFL